MRRAVIMATSAVGALTVLSTGCTLQRVRFGGAEHVMSANDARVLTHYDALAPKARPAREECEYWSTTEAVTRQRTDLSEQAHRLMREHSQAVCRRASDEAVQASWRKPETGKRTVEPPIEVAARRLMNCDTGCAEDFRTCVRGPGTAPERELCVSTYQSCQAQCETEFNAVGFCVERNILTGRPTGAVGPCP